MTDIIIGATLGIIINTIIWGICYLFYKDLKKYL
jgi:hypothetical protein